MLLALTEDAPRARIRVSKTVDASSDAPCFDSAYGAESLGSVTPMVGRVPISRRTPTLPSFLWKECISSGIVSDSTCGLYLVPLAIYGRTPRLTGQVCFGWLVWGCDAWAVACFYRWRTTRTEEPVSSDVPHSRSAWAQHVSVMGCGRPASGTCCLGVAVACADRPHVVADDEAQSGVVLSGRAGPALFEVAVSSPHFHLIVIGLGCGHVDLVGGGLRCIGSTRRTGSLCCRGDGRW
ncbi:Uncharacterised protein [Mycobacteroides abscessus subsp. bolletii]|nr:Uncharacterised protein [Mycobacteroides abscessus subsp. bolletii]